MFIKAQQPFPKLLVKGIAFFVMLEGVEGGSTGHGPADGNGESAFNGRVHLHASSLVRTTMPGRGASHGVG